MRAANSDAAFADSRKHGIPVGALEVGTALGGLPEQAQGFAVAGGRDPVI